MKRATVLRPRGKRRGGAAVELALLLPFLCFMFVAATDFARLFYFGVTLENCARNGAYYASDYPNNSYVYTDIYGYRSLDDAVLRDASNLSTPPTYTIYYSNTPDGPYTLTTKPFSGGYAQVSVQWTFSTITNYPGIDTTWNLSRVCRMRIAPAMPIFP